MKPTVKAYPHKRFFIEMFTRDIALEDCILDLVDNSVDAILRTRAVNIEEEVLASGMGKTLPKRERAQVRVDYGDSRFRISDNCGGITYDDAVNEVFCFGHSSDAPKGRLGVYGIGLKRAIFKIGNKIQVESNTPDSAFRVDIDVEDWAKKEDRLSDWTFPITKLG